MQLNFAGTELLISYIFFEYIFFWRVYRALVNFGSVTSRNSHTREKIQN